MIGHIDYLNLLPFYQFLKKKGIKVRKSYPKKINFLFERKKVDGAFISSIKAKNKKCLHIGIIANKKVKTVLVCKGDGEDKESETSNMLAKILKIKGKVIIGDKAFKEKNCVDLANEWYKKYNLPFVFAIFCVNRDYKKYKKLTKEFLKKNQKVSYYLLKKYIIKNNISLKEAKEYLEKIIYYKIKWKEKKSLRKFWKLTKNMNYKK